MQDGEAEAEDREGPAGGKPDDKSPPGKDCVSNTAGNHNHHMPRCILSWNL